LDTRVLRAESPTHIPAHGEAKRSHGIRIKEKKRAESLIHAVWCQILFSTWIRLSAL